MQLQLTAIFFILLLFLSQRIYAEEYDIEVNYDIGHFKLLQLNHTLKIVCKNLRNSSPPSWTHPSSVFNNPRVTISYDGAVSSLVINETKFEDAGEYGCHIEHRYNGNKFTFDKKIEVIVNDISEVKEEETEDGIKLICIVHAYPSPTVFWKIEYNDGTLRPQVEEDKDYQDLYKNKVVVFKSRERWTVRPYNAVNNTELIIANATKKDNGVYSCFAVNPAGEVHKDVNVIITRGQETIKSGISKVLLVVMVVLTLATVIAALTVVLILAGAAYRTAVEKLKGSVVDLHNYRNHNENRPSASRKTRLEDLI